MKFKPVLHNLLIFLAAFCIASAVQAITPEHSGLANCEVGNIPTLVSWAGQGTSFWLESNQVDAVSVEVLHESTPSLTNAGITIRNHLFEYKPSVTDWGKIRLRFISSNPQLSATQDISLLVYPKVKPDYICITSTTPLPDEEGRDYWRITEQAATGVTLNYHTNEARNITISGKKIVFDKDHPQFAALNGNEDIQNLMICGETVEIRMPLYFPQTHVSIYANTLSFIDANGDIASCIDTTPVSLTNRPAPLDSSYVSYKAANGQNGLNGGDIQVFAGAIIGTNGIRFFLTGGNGQPAGVGRDGNAGACINPLNLSKDDYNGNISVPGWNPMILDPNGGKLKKAQLMTCVGIQQQGGKLVRGTTSFPSDGEDAVTGGLPGSAGNAGCVSSSLYLENCFKAMDGIVGAKSTTARGGPPGSPTNSVKLTIGPPMGFFPNVLMSVELHSTKPGKDAEPPIPSLPQIEGHKPKVLYVTNGHLAYIHPNWIQHVIDYAKDAWLRGHSADAERAFQAYHQQVAEYLTLSCITNYLNDEEIARLALLNQETTQLLTRLKANLDFYGNPPGWTPMVSYETASSRYSLNVEPTLRLWMLSSWFTEQTKNLSDKKANLAVLKRNEQATIETAIKDYNGALDTMPELFQRTDQVTHELESKRQEFAEADLRLKQNAQRKYNEEQDKLNEKSDFEELAGVASLALSVVPGYAGLGTGVKAISTLDTHDSKKMIAGLSTAAGGFRDFNAAAAKDHWRELGSEITKDDKSLNKVKYFAKEGASVLENYSKAIADQQAVSVPSTDYDSILSELMASDSNYQKLGQQLAEVAAEQEAAIQAMNANAAKVASLNSEISAGYATVVAIDSEMRSASAKIDHEMELALSDIKARAFARLQEHLYYSQRAYEHQYLKPAPANFVMDRIAPRIAETLRHNDSLEFFHSEAALQQLKALYDEQVNQMDNAIYSDIVSSFQSMSGGTKKVILSESQLDALARNGIVYIDLAEQANFALQHENMRLIGVTSGLIENSNTLPSLEVTFEHCGISRITQDGSTYLFDYRGKDQSRPFTWNFEVVSGRLVEKPSYMPRIKLRGSTDALYVYPGALTRIKIAIKRTRTGSHSNLPRFKSFGFEFAYWYQEVANGSKNATLEILPNIVGLKPFINIDQPDISGNASGYGAIRRSYLRDQIVKINCPSQYGRYHFRGWRDEDGNIIETALPDKAIELKMDENRSLTAIYDEAVQTK